MIKRLIENFIVKATNWCFRVKSPQAIILSSAMGLLALIYGGQYLIAEILRLVLGAVPEGFLKAQRALDLADFWILLICSLMILFALGLYALDYSKSAKARSKKRVIVIEGRGLRDDDGSSLVSAATDLCDGQITPVLLDLRNCIDGIVAQQQQALGEITATHRSVLQHKKGCDRSDLSTVYGGLTPVPYTFLTGVLLDDEGKIVTLDWDRTQEKWRALDRSDDGKSFNMVGFGSAEICDEVVLALAYSYPINDNDLKSTFSEPIVRMTLDGLSSDSHWSQEKQNRLAQEFLEAAKTLSKKGVKRIHLVMAAPNSVVFTFGRRYDKRNLPEIVVYQYQRGSAPSYPWGVLMPTTGIERADIVTR